MMKRSLLFCAPLFLLAACSHRPIDECQSLGATPGTERYFQCNDTLHGAGATEHQSLYTVKAAPGA